MKNVFLIIPWLAVFLVKICAQVSYPDNESKDYQDMLTPGYYLSGEDDPLRKEINKFIYFCQAEPYHHPLKNPTGEIPQYSTPSNGEFGAGKGRTGISQHHAAIDFHVGNRETDVLLFATHGGHVSIYREAPKYRHYLSISKNISDSLGNTLGMLVTLYAHIDLDLDSADNQILEGKYVEKGELVSRHLYSGTVGGPHLHFEIRYYRPGEKGVEGFYGMQGFGNAALTTPSAGKWSYGYWNPDVGYGFGNPANHLVSYTASDNQIDSGSPITIHPIPTEDHVTVTLDKVYSAVQCCIVDMGGVLMDSRTIRSASSAEINLSGFDPGVYLFYLTGLTRKTTCIKAVRK